MGDRVRRFCDRESTPRTHSRNRYHFLKRWCVKGFDTLWTEVKLGKFRENECMRVVDTLWVSEVDNLRGKDRPSLGFTIRLIYRV